MGPLEILAVDLGEIETLIRHRDSLTDLEKDLDAIVDWSNQDPEHIALINKYRSLRLPRNETLDCSLLVMAWGAFERFLSNLFIECADSIAVPEEVRSEPIRIVNQNTIYTGKAITGHILKPHRYSTAPLTMSQRLSAFLSGDTSSKLNSDALSIIDFSLTSESILTYFSRIDLDLDWSEVGNNPQVKSHVKENSKKNAGEEAKNKLDWIYKKRNIIAHTGGSEINLHPHTILDLVSFLNIIANALHRLAHDKLK